MVHGPLRLHRPVAHATQSCTTCSVVHYNIVHAPAALVHSAVAHSTLTGTTLSTAWYHVDRYSMVHVSVERVRGSVESVQYPVGHGKDHCNTCSKARYSMVNPKQNEPLLTAIPAASPRERFTNKETYAE